MELELDLELELEEGAAIEEKHTGSGNDGEKGLEGGGQTKAGNEQNKKNLNGVQAGTRDGIHR